MFENAHIIHSYTRADALEDGFLVDVSPMARTMGFVIPIAMTSTAYQATVEVDDIDTLNARLRDVLTMAHFAAKGAGENQDQVPFKVAATPQGNAELPAKTHNLTLHIGPGDNHEPVLTIMMEGED